MSNRIVKHSSRYRGPAGDSRPEAEIFAGIEARAQQAQLYKDKLLAAMDEVKAARAKLRAHLGRFRPTEPAGCGVALVVKWCFPRGDHADGEYRTTKPDVDNLQKLLMDCMTAEGFWRDDAQVVSLVVEKFWADIPGIYIRVREV